MQVLNHESHQTFGLGTCRISLLAQSGFIGLGGDSFCFTGLGLLSRGQEWVARKVEEALTIAPAEGPIRDFLQSMANRHRAEVEWGRAEVIRLLGGDK